jgi:hypothetical protein
MENHKFVFICGLHKSGTSVFAKTLAEHPQISGFAGTGVPQNEGQHLQTVYPTAQAYGGMAQFGFHPEAHLTESSPLVTAENKTRLFAEWKQYWDLSKPILLEKSPPNVIRTRFLQAMFPNSYFIVITRHPIAASYATQKKGFHETVLDSRLKHWLVCHDILQQDKKYLNHVLMLRYEDFVKDTATTLRQIFTFLETDYAPTSMEIRPNVNDKYFAKWQKFRSRPILKSYANHLINKYEARLQPYGYSMERLD